MPFRSLALGLRPSTRPKAQDPRPKTQDLKPKAKLLISPQCLNRIQSRCFPCRKDSGDYPGASGGGECTENCKEREVSWEHHRSDNVADDPSQENPDSPTEDCERSGLHQKLFQYVHLPRAEGFSDADLLVRSVTETSMIFMMTIAPTISAIPGTSMAT